MISNKETALLGLLYEGDMHAYEVEKTARFRAMRTWTEISMSSIYKVLAGLERKGLVKSVLRPGKRNVQQKVYSITQKGRAQTAAKLKHILSEPEHLVHRFDLGTYFMPGAGIKEALKALNVYTKKLRERIKGWKETEKCLREMKCPDYRIAVTRRPVYLYEAELKFIRDLIKTLR